MDFSVYVLFGVLIHTGVNGYCPDGFVTHQGVCYKEFGIRATWTEANTYCDAYGGQLATVSDNTEQLFIQGMLERLTPGSMHSDIYWLGGNDGPIEGQWEWSSSRQIIIFKNWKSGEPNNAGAGEDCMAMAYKDNFKWNDMPCSNKYSFVCEVRDDLLVG